MNRPTDEQIFNYMKPDDYSCLVCNEETKELDCGCYVTRQCLSCGYTPEHKKSYEFNSNKVN